MKTLLSLVLAFSTTASFAQTAKPAAEAAATTYKVDTSNTKVTYVGSKKVGESHTGQIKAKDGWVTVKGEVITAGEITMDMNSITSTDLTDKEANGKFIGHMKSADFFNTAKYPDSKLVIKSSKKTAKGLEVEGEMTMIGQTGPVKFTATDVKSTAELYSAKANIDVDRTKWGLKYGSGQFFKGLGDKIINDNFTLQVELTAKK
ncbi:MAG TPA: YceI family protein [Bacteriovoracaceae bacterium]|nr:YceI family protein [Bacteriovoracaceae bacterium]